MLIRYYDKCSLQFRFDLIKKNVMELNLSCTCKGTDLREEFPKMVFYPAYSINNRCQHYNHTTANATANF
jgi:hypothetical protein